MTRDVEENVGTVYFDVIRSLGSLDTISVDMVTIATTSHAQTGADIILSVISQVGLTEIYLHFIRNLRQRCVFFIPTFDYLT